MSVPLPSPSTIPSSSARPIPRSRPQPISIHPTDVAPSSPNGHVASHSARRVSRSSGLGQSPSNDSNWRERSGSALGRSNGPERTVGGFEKKEAGSQSSSAAGGGTAGLSQSPSSTRKLNSVGDKGASLSHVPCRFYKAGQCTAGDTCPFSHGEGGKKEVCQWFLKGNCKFGHKCALAHVRPGEAMSMDRKNKKAAQLEARLEKEKSHPEVHAPAEKRSSLDGPRPARLVEQPDPSPSAPVTIRSALSSSIQSPPAQRLSSSPMREPYGPPATANESGTAASGFLGRSPGPGAFGASPNRPSPLSSSFSARFSGAAPIPGSLALKGSPTTAIHPAHPHTGISPRPPVTATAGFSSSFSHSPLVPDPIRPPLSASFADSSPLGRSIWSRMETPDEPLSPRRLIVAQGANMRARPNVFDDDEDHGEDLLPSSLSELLTPMERARRMSRRDSNESGASPRPSGPLSAAAKPISPSGAAWPNVNGAGERLAQSAGAAMGQVGFLQSLWSSDGADLRKGPSTGDKSAQEFAFGPSTARPAPAPRQSLLSQQRSPVSPLRYSQPQATPHDSPVRDTTALPPGLGGGDGLGRSAEKAFDAHAELAPPYFTSRRQPDPSSPSARALSEHAPGQSLPGGVATALSRLHLAGSPGTNPAAGAGAGRWSNAGTDLGGVGVYGYGAANGVNGLYRANGPGGAKGEDTVLRDGGGTPDGGGGDEGIFAMDG